MLKMGEEFPLLSTWLVKYCKRITHRCLTFNNIKIIEIYLPTEFIFFLYYHCLPVYLLHAFKVSPNNFLSHLSKCFCTGGSQFYLFSELWKLHYITSLHVPPCLLLLFTVIMGNKIQEQGF